jgi:predicted DNA-binding helix-hairpin-helix protein
VALGLSLILAGPAHAAANKAASGQKVDLNTATERDLEALPRVGPASAKKIIAARPYASTADLGKAGLSKKTVGDCRRVPGLQAAGEEEPVARKRPHANAFGPFVRTIRTGLTNGPGGSARILA